jgi:uncharacterized protein YbaR (Trm112 family)/SAM-dependent methyltransferase
MKKQLLELLICPNCIPAEFPLHPTIILERNGDIETGTLKCHNCSAQFVITNGIANLDPFSTGTPDGTNKYETPEVVSSYLWSHYSDLLDDENCSQAYSTWARQMLPHGGISLDAGGAVGRFTFEMSSCCDFAIGIDNSVAFIRAARQLMADRHIVIDLKDEGLLQNKVTLRLPQKWLSDKVEFIVANALALPFRKDSLASFSSLNLIDKVPSPLKHLLEMNRVTRENDAQFLLSDPFSWSTEAAPMTEWLGGLQEGPYSGKGITNIASLLRDVNGRLQPAWQVAAPDSVWWKIRTHTNHYELIQSCFIHASR